MSWLRWLPMAVPLALAVLLWWLPVDGDDVYYHAIRSVEQHRAWHEGAVFPRYHRGWNAGTGSFLPTVYSPIPLALGGGLTAATGEALRGVSLTLVCGLLVAAAILAVAWRRRGASLLATAPYMLALILTRATTSELWAVAGAAVILAFGLPFAAAGRRRDLAVAGGIVLVAGSQLAMLVELAWVLGGAWIAAGVLVWSNGAAARRAVAVSCRRVAGWVVAGLTAAGFLWLPNVMDGRYLALDEATEGPFFWRHHFLPGSSELSLFLTVVAASLMIVIVIVALRGQGDDRKPIVAAALLALLLTLVVSTPFWHLPGMRFLQFPWRFLGPATVLAVMGLGSLSGRSYRFAVIVLLAPLAVLPVRLAPADGGIPASASPSELATIAQDRWGLAPILPSDQGFYAPGFDRLASLGELHRQSASVNAEFRTANSGRWRVVTDGVGPVFLPIQWWPEWRVEVGGEKVDYYNRSGLVSIEMAANEQIVQARLGFSLSRRVGAVVSFCGLSALALLWRRQRSSGDR
ncbi:MAG: hypothetical protein PVG92_00030 [Holophagae bacterium]|jgi:hypothetical protein